MTIELQRKCKHCEALSYVNNPEPCLRCGGKDFEIVRTVEQSHYMSTTRDGLYD